MTGKYLKRKWGQFCKWVEERPYYIRRWYVRKRVKSRDFTIISNNCWAGRAYQYFDMPYLSPTVGLYFFAEDYLKFVSDLRGYMAEELVFIKAEGSKYAEELTRRKQLDIPVARLGDVEIVFLHYKTEEEAREKWNRRRERINWDNLIIKFSRMNLCTDEHIRRFCKLPYRNKFVLTFKRKPEYRDEYYWAGERDENEIIRDTNPFPGNIPLIRLLGRKKETYPANGLGRER